MQSYTGVSGSTSDGIQLNIEIDNQQAQQMDDDAQAILEQRAPKTPGEEGLRDIHVLNAIIEAARRNQSVML